MLKHKIKISCRLAAVAGFLIYMFCMDKLREIAAANFLGAALAVMFVVAMVGFFAAGFDMFDVGEEETE